MSKIAQEATLEAVERRAMEIVAMPDAERKQHYRIIRAAYHSAALELGRDEKQAAEMAAKMVEFTEGLVDIIESSGDGKGGRA
jgi:hypothetical protein